MPAATATEAARGRRGQAGVRAGGPSGQPSSGTFLSGRDPWRRSRGGAVRLPPGRALLVIIVVRVISQTLGHFPPLSSASWSFLELTSTEGYSSAPHPFFCNFPLRFFIPFHPSFHIYMALQIVLFSDFTLMCF